MRKLVSTGGEHLADMVPWIVLLVALALTVLEGALRKWVEPFGEGVWKYAAYFSKDVAFAALLLFPARGGLSAPLQTFRLWLIAGCALLLVGAVISAEKQFNLVGAALTLRAAVFLPLLACFAVPRLKGTSADWAAWLLCGLAVANFALAVVQNRLPADHVLNRYATDAQAVVVLESGVRATGTFSYITGLAVMSSVGIWAGMVLLSLAGNHWQRLAGWAAIVAGFGCGLVSVSRAPVVIAAVVMVLWILISRATISVLVRSAVACALLVGGLIVFDVIPIFSEHAQNLRDRQEAAGDSFKERAFGQLGEARHALEMAPLGLGLGTEQVGGNFYATGQMEFTNFESQLPRLVLETGALGLAGFLVVCAGAIFALETAKRKAQSDGEKSMLLATQLFLLPIFYTNIIFNHTASAFVWMIFAVALAGCEGETKAAYQESARRESRRGFTRRARAAA